MTLTPPVTRTVKSLPTTEHSLKWLTTAETQLKLVQATTVCCSSSSIFDLPHHSTPTHWSMHTTHTTQRVMIMLS